MLWHTLFLLIAGHFLCDYPLQGDWLSKAKNLMTPPVPGETIWPLAMTGHAMIHATAVLVITGSMPLAIAELGAHAVIDNLRCRGWLTYNGDQIMHLLCKVLWVAILFWVP